MNGKKNKEHDQADDPVSTDPQRLFEIQYPKRVVNRELANITYELCSRRPERIAV